jgi:zinc protease
MVEKLTLADVNSAIKSHLQYGNMAIAIVTKDAASFRDALVNNTPSPITYKTPKPAEILTKDKEIETFPLNITSGDVRIIPVGELFVK